MLREGWKARQRGKKSTAMGHLPCVGKGGTRGPREGQEWMTQQARILQSWNVGFQNRGTEIQKGRRLLDCEQLRLAGKESQQM